MKEFETFVKSLSDTIKSLGKIAEAMAEKLEQDTEVKAKAKATTAMRKPAAKPARKTVARKPVQEPAKRPARRKAFKPEEGTTMVGAVQATIDTNPGIDFKSLKEKTGFDDKQLRNTVARLKSQGKITTEGRGLYHPVVAREPEAVV